MLWIEVIKKKEKHGTNLSQVCDWFIVQHDKYIFENNLRNIQEVCRHLIANDSEIVLHYLTSLTLKNEATVT